MKFSPEGYRKLAALAVPAEAEIFAELAIEEGLLTVDRLEECRRESAENGATLADLLVRKGYLWEKDVARLRERQAEESILRAPGWRYEIRACLGRGATAVVYRAWDRELRREVALKVVRYDLATNPEIIQRLLREARTAAGLHHPNIVPVHDVGERDGVTYFVMDLVEGKSLAEVLRDPVRPLPEKIRMLLRIAEAVDFAHRRGVIHRDLKPMNVVVDAAGEPHVTDFGLARLAGSESLQTRTGAVVGTPLYMAPEQIQGKPDEIGPRTDVYALGAILYETLTGRPPHTGDNLAQLYTSILQKDPAPPRTFQSSVSPDLEIVALKALEREPRARYATPAEFAADLKSILEGEPIQGRRSGRIYRIGRKIRRYPIQAALLGSSTLLAIVSLSLSTWILREPEPVPPRPPSTRAVALQRLSSIHTHLCALRADLRAGRLPKVVARREHRRILTDLSSVPPGLPEADYIRARAELIFQGPQSALDTLRPSLARYPAFARNRMLFACALAELEGVRLPDVDSPGPTAELRDALSQALRGRPARLALRETSDDLLLVEKTRALHARWVENDTRKAQRLLNMSLSENRSEELLHLLGQWSGDRGENLRLQEEALRLAPKYLPALLERAALLSDVGSIDPALQEYSTILNLFPDEPRTLAARGLLYSRAGNTKAALLDLQAARKSSTVISNLLEAKWKELEKK